MTKYFNINGEMSRNKGDLENVVAYINPNKDGDNCFILCRCGKLYRDDLPDFEKKKDGWRFTPINEVAFNAYIMFLKTKEEYRYRIAQRQL